MISLDTISSSEFEACLQEIFSLVLSDGKFPLQLDKVSLVTGSHPDAKRAPFTLTFKSAHPIRLPQSIYTVEHERLGAMEIFLVQSSPTEVEATFN